MGAVEQGHGTVACFVEDGLPGAGVCVQFIAVTLPKLLPALHPMVEPFPQLRAGGHFLDPRIGVETLLLHASRPETFHQDSPAITASGRLIRAFDPNHDVLRGLRRSICSELGFERISVPARACDTGQPAFAAWACSANVAWSMPRTLASQTIWLLVILKPPPCGASESAIAKQPAWAAPSSSSGLVPSPSSNRDANE